MATTISFDLPDDKVSDVLEILSLAMPEVDVSGMSDADGIKAITIAMIQKSYYDYRYTKKREVVLSQMQLADAQAQYEAALETQSLIIS